MPVARFRADRAPRIFTIANAVPIPLEYRRPPAQARLVAWQVPRDPAAHERLADAIADARANDQPIPCHDSSAVLRKLFTSDTSGELRRAAELCLGCPVIAACRVAGRSEAGGVWGGVLRRESRGAAPRPDWRNDD